MRTQNAEEMTMRWTQQTNKSLRRASAIFLAAIVLSMLSAHAFTGSEEQRYEAQIQAARERGKDFRLYREGEQRRTQARENAVVDEKATKAREEAAAEEARRQYAALAGQREEQAKAWARLEQEDDRSRAEREKKIEDLQRKYALFKDQMRLILEREDSLSEAVEFDAFSRENPHGENPQRAASPRQ
jgi:hypothetical protein